MCDATFAFSQRGSHYLQCPSRREITRLPKKLSTLLSSAQLQKVHHVALGFEDSFLVTWRDQNAQDHIDSLGLPPALQEFLYARNAQQKLVRNIPSIRCSLGPYNSTFLVHDSSAYLWLNLPTTLLSTLQARIKDGNWIDRPRLVALGANDNFVLITEWHTAIWDLKNYPTLAKLLEFSNTQERGISEIHAITLHSYRYGCFVTQSRNGTLIHENLPQHTLSSIQAISESIMLDTKAAERDALALRESTERENISRRLSNLQQRAQLRREWGNHSQRFTAQTKGTKISLSLSVSIGGITRALG
ncbi:hypothetical protein GQ44DRAFT_607784 [Phaeosphaeriaceae sp. PMI808]|nr:hypothetical protein GQ44DRAFT_607784 [Phaeosphaeriaceae sp. PMI808]